MSFKKNRRRRYPEYYCFYSNDVFEDNDCEKVAVVSYRDPDADSDDEEARVFYYCRSCYWTVRQTVIEQGTLSLLEGFKNL